MSVERKGSMISRHIRSNVVGYIAIFMFALGGSAYATHPGGKETIDSADIIDGEVFSVDVTDDTLAGGGLAAADLRPDSVGTSEVVPNSIGTNEVGINSLTELDLATNSVRAEEINTQAVGTDEVAFESLTFADLATNSVGPSEIQNSTIGTDEVAFDSLTTNDILDSTLGGVGSAYYLENGSDDIAPHEVGNITGASLNDCNPAGSFISCGAVSLTLPQAGPVLVLANGGFFGTSSGADAGTCKIMEGTTNVGGDISIGQAANDHSSASTADGFALSGFASLSAGLHTWQLQCNQTAGDFRVNNPKIAAIYLF